MGDGTQATRDRTLTNRPRKSICGVSRTACGALWALSCALGGLLSSCTGVGPPADSSSLAALAWPAQNPQVRLEKVIDLAPALGNRWLGRQDPAEGVERPFAATWQADDLVIADPDAQRLLRIRANGRVAQSASVPDSSLVGVVSCWGGLIVADSRQGTVTRWDDALKPRQQIANLLVRPSGLACAGDTLYVAETGRHRIVALRDGSAQRAFGGRGETRGQFNFPTFMAFAADGLWVADTLNFRLQRLDPSSGAYRGGFGHLGDAPGDLPRAKGIAIDSAGHLWVSDGLYDRVLVFRQSGELLLAIGGPGRGPGEFSFPAGIAAHQDGRVAVVDSLNRRVQVFRTLKETNS